MRVEHPGVLVAKVGYFAFGVKSAKVYQVQMGTKPAKVGRLASTLLNKSTWVLRNEDPPSSPPQIFAPWADQSC